MLKKLLLLLLALLLSLSLTQVAQAQDSSQAAELRDPSSGQIWQKDQLSQEIINIKAQYQSHLIDYLAKEKLYRNAFDQNKQLQTLASLEDILQKSKTLGLARDQVLISYLTLLKLSLIETTGIELSIKSYYLDQLESHLSFLQNHQRDLNELTEREAVRASLANFASQEDKVEDLAQAVQVLLSVGKLQIIYDQATVLKRDVDSYLTTQGKSENAIVARASLETSNSLESTKIKLNEFWATALARYSNSNFLSNFYYDIARDLNPTYVNLSQSLSYLDELLNS